MSFLTSSANPEKVSLFVKSIAVFAVLYGVDESIVTELQNSLIVAIVAVAQAGSAIVAFYGLARKMYLGRWSAK